MDLKESLHILQRLGISFSQCTNSFLSSVIAEVTNTLPEIEYENLIQIATRLQPFVANSRFTPLWVALLGQLAVIVQHDEVAKILADISRIEMEHYEAGRDWLPIPVLEQLFMIYLPCLEQRVLIMLNKLVVDSSLDMEEVIRSSSLVALGRREAHINECICSILDALMLHSTKIEQVKNCFTSFLNRNLNT